MVSHLVRLRYLLMWNGYKRSTSALIGTIFSTLGYLGLIVMTYFVAIIVGMTSSGELSYAERGAPVILLGVIFVVGWVFGPIVMSASNPFTNPQNFLTFGIPHRQFVPGVLLGGMVAPTGMGTLVLLMASTVLWGWNPAAITAAAIAAVIGWVLCVLMMQVVVGLLTNVVSKRGVRDTIQMLMLIPLMLAGFIILGAIETIQQFWQLLPDIAAWVAFSPAGFLALPVMVAQGQWGLAAVHLVVMLAYVGLFYWAYHKVVNRAVEFAGTTKERQRDNIGLGLFGLADSSMKAIWARSLHSWFKDPRYAANLLIVAVLIGIGVLQLVLIDASDGFHIFTKAFPAIIAYLLSFAISADLSYDSTGFSLHVTSGVRGIDDRLGRVFGLLTWALPLIVVLNIGFCWATDSLDELAAWLGLSIGVLLSSAAVSSVSSARYIYPVPPPGASPMAQPEGGMGRTMVVQTVGMLAQLIIALPVIILTIISIIAASPAMATVTLMVGVLYGAGLLWLGVRLGAKWFDRAQPEAYQAIVRVAALY